MNTIAHTGRDCPRHPDLDGPRACRTCADAHLAAVQAAYLDLSDAMDQLRAQIGAAELRGYQRGLDAAEAAYHTGLADAILTIKRLNKGFVGELRAHLAMWGGRPRGRFAEPRKGDFPGRDRQPQRAAS